MLKLEREKVWNEGRIATCNWNKNINDFLKRIIQQEHLIYAKEKNIATDRKIEHFKL